jgi:16S rRNA (cytidine1402-2'-O)-methyltransferase
VLLAQAAVQAGIKVEVIPGASALLVALLGAGLDTGAFTFSGFLEARSTDRKKQLEAWKTRRETQVMFVSPHQVRAALKDVLAVWGDRPAALARELTKLHEEYIRGTLAEIVEHLATHEPRGEYTLVVAGNTLPEAAPALDESLEEQLARLQGEGFSVNQAVARVARDRGLPRGEVYARAHRPSGE